MSLVRREGPIGRAKYVHVYHVKSGKPVEILLRPGKTPSGAEVRTLLKHLVRRIRRHWPHSRIVFRGDSHCRRPEAMAWCKANGVDYVFRLSGNRALHALAYDVADDLRVRRAEADADRMRRFAAIRLRRSLLARGTPGTVGCPAIGGWCDA